MPRLRRNDLIAYLAILFHIILLTIPPLIFHPIVKLIKSYRLIQNPEKNHNPSVFFEDLRIYIGLEFSKLVEKYWRS